MTHAYHATLEQFLPSIALHGLRPTRHAKSEGDYQDILFVEEDQEGAEVYIELGGSLLRFPCQRTQMTPDGENYLEEVIPAKELEILHNGQWIPLSGEDGAIQYHQVEPNSKLGREAWEILWSHAINNPAQQTLEKGFLNEMESYPDFIKSIEEDRELFPIVLHVLTMHERAIATALTSITHWEDLRGDFRWREEEIRIALQHSGALYINKIAAHKTLNHCGAGQLLYRELDRQYPDLQQLTFTSMEPILNTTSVSFHKKLCFKQCCLVLHPKNPDLQGAGWYRQSPKQRPLPR